MSGGHDDGPGFAGKLLVGAIAIGIIAVSVHFLAQYPERWGWVDVKYVEQPKPHVFRGVTPPPLPSVPTKPVPTTRSVERGPPAPAAPIPGYDLSEACKDPRAERRVNPTTGNRSCYVPDR